MIKIEFPADRKDIAMAIGKALTEVGQDSLLPATTVDSFSEVAEPDGTLYSPHYESQDSQPSDTISQAATQVDEKGVPFNDEFCGKATIPFYGSGKKKGQWKKRQGVDEAAYDEWYAEALLNAKVEEDTTQTETIGDSNIAASVFANDGNPQNAVASEHIPQDAGQLMKWVSEQQVAGNITQQQVTDAYIALRLPLDAIMNPAYPVADNCSAIYNFLKGNMG